MEKNHEFVLVKHPVFKHLREVCIGCPNEATYHCNACGVVVTYSKPSESTPLLKKELACKVNS